MHSLKTYRLKNCNSLIVFCVLYNTFVIVVSTNNVENRDVQYQQHIQYQQQNQQQQLQQRQQSQWIDPGSQQIQQQNFQQGGQTPREQVFNSPQGQVPRLNPNDQVFESEATSTQWRSSSSQQTDSILQTGGSVAGDQFVRNLYQIVGASNTHKNVIYSPISMQTLLAFIYLGATGNTARELQTALQIPYNKTDVAFQFEKLLRTLNSQNGQTELVMTNKMFVNNLLKVRERISEAARQFFHSDIETVNFGDTSNTAYAINEWVAQQTFNHIRNIIVPNSIDHKTQSILLNAIYFKGRWAKEFSASNTQRQAFTNSNQRVVQADMMFLEETFPYKDFPSLGASILEMPYTDPNISMLVVLPYENNTLQNVEKQIRNIEIPYVASQLRPEMVTVQIPKFRIEFELDMIEALKLLNIREVFTEKSDLREFFENDKSVLISRVQHKAFLEVNEAGSEAAAATFTRFYPLSLPPKPIYFIANRPFMFMIRNKSAMLFMGHVVNP